MKAIVITHVVVVNFYCYCCIFGHQTSTFITIYHDHNAKSYKITGKNIVNENAKKTNTNDKKKTECQPNIIMVLHNNNEKEVLL